jgi:hypothetical protein
MNRIQNHREGGIASVYDRHGYPEENKRIMEAVAAHIMKRTGRSPATSCSFDNSGVSLERLSFPLLLRPG